VLELADDNGRAGYGEIAPLRGFSRETLVDCLPQLKYLAQLWESCEQIDSTKLYPSVEFGFESALVDFETTDSEPDNAVLVNALPAGSKEEILNRTSELCNNGSECFKLKITADNLESQVKLIGDVRAVIGPSRLLRLDANRSLSVEQYHNLLMQIDRYDIEYIEEPTEDYAGALDVLSRYQIGVALDESLADNDDNWGDISHPSVRAIILKPMLLGLQKTRRLIAIAESHSKKWVVSSAFATSLGMRAHLRIAANAPDTYHGLGTLDYLESDLIDPPISISNGRINLSDLTPISDSLRRDLLTGVAL
jgi:O-succinylbenzoate synthase